MSNYKTTLYIGFGDYEGVDMPVEVLYSISPATTEGDGRPVPAELAIDYIMVEIEGKQVDMSPVIPESLINDLSQRIQSELPEAIEEEYDSDRKFGMG